MGEQNHVEKDTTVTNTQACDNISQFPGFRGPQIHPTQLISGQALPFGSRHPLTLLCAAFVGLTSCRLDSFGTLMISISFTFMMIRHGNLYLK